jgi:hypothetical protein
MTNPTTVTPPVFPIGDNATPKSTRVQRMGMPRMKQVLREVAEQVGVCIRPIALRCIDTYTGEAVVFDVPCGATLASKCKPCANKWRRTRIQQIREGWHLTEEPVSPEQKAGEDVRALVRLRAQFEIARDDAERAARWDQVADVDQAITELDEALAKESLRGFLTPPGRKRSERQVRSTRRRQDAPDLPRLPVENRTIGRTYTGKDGRQHRPSMLISLTLGSYGKVHTGIRHGIKGTVRPCDCGQLHGQRDPLLGVPVDMTSYDYRSAALDAIHFAAVLDRWWQNLRRGVGWKVQYAGSVELQKRLAPHAHFAIRGTIPRAFLKRVAAATYHQVWWPQFHTPIYALDRLPVWDADTQSYLDPDTRTPLLAWKDAIRAIKNESTAAKNNPELARPEPAYVARFGTIDARGITAGTVDAERSIRYVTKYITKNIADEAAVHSDPQREHFDRLHAHLTVLPCSPTCANWLLYGVQPLNAKAGLVPARCKGKVHQRASLGFTGRRVLVSRQWSLKTLADVRADQRAWVRAIIAGSVNGTNGQAGPGEESGDPAAGPDAPAARPDPADGPRRYLFELAKPGSPGVADLETRVQREVGRRIQQRAALDAARTRAASDDRRPGSSERGEHA